ncbi:MAG: hypothetical protein ACYC9O_13240 [Candidatus Latescibacterota bacterium]
MNANNPVRRDMHLLIVALFEESYVDNLVLSLTSIGGGHVTIIDGISGTRNLSEAIPFFAEFLGMGSRKICKVLLTAVSQRDPVVHLLEVLEEADIPFAEKGLGEVYAIPLSEAITVEGDMYELF